MKQIVFLIPPSEGKADGGQHKPLKNYPKSVEEIHKRFLEYDKSYQSLIGVKGNYLEESIENNKKILSNPTMKALKRYTGTMYKHLDYKSLSEDAKAFAENHFVITSAMFGFVFGKELIPNYKLKMNKLKAYKHWKKHAKSFLKDYLVVDVLTTTHRKSVSYEDGVQIDFKKMKNGKKRGAGHAGKKIKGKFLRWVAKNQITDVSELETFSEDGYVWDGSCFLKE